MKPSYQGFEAKKSSFTDLPPVGAYCAEIMNVVFISGDEKDNLMKRDVIELYIDITEGDYKGRYVEQWNDQKERFGDKVAYKGIYRLVPPVEGDQPWRRTKFENDLWCVEQSNAGYHWDWDENKLKGKKVGINVRKRLYNYTNKSGDIVNAESTEIGKFESIQDVKDGKWKPMKDRDTRKDIDSSESGDTSGYTKVDEKKHDVPW